MQHGWLIAETYNSIIAAFGIKFDDFSFRELASFNANLGQIGLRQADIIKETVKRLREYPTKEEENQQKLPFQSVFFPILKAIVDLDLTATKVEGSEESLIESLTDDAFAKQVMRGDLTFNEQALRDNQVSLDLLVTILKGRLDETSPKFKDLVSPILW